MALPALNYIVGVKLTLKEKAAPTSSITVYFANRPNHSSDLSNGIVWPILEECSDIGAEADLYVPTFDSGSFTIGNDIGSFGWNRKFSDILQRYAVSQQAVEIHLFENAIGTESYEFVTGTKVWAGKIESWTSDASADHATITFNYSIDKIPDRPITRQVSTIESSANLGQYGALILGESKVPAVRSGWNSTLNYASYVYGTEFDNDFNPAGGAIWARCHDDIYCQANAEGAALGGVVNTDQGLSTQPNIAYKMLFVIPSTDTNAAIMYGIDVKLFSNGTGAPSTATLFARIYNVDKTTMAMLDEVASGSVSMVDYDAFNNNPGAYPSFTASIYLDQAVALNLTKYYYAVSFSYEGYTVDDASLGITTGTTTNRWITTKDTAAANNTNEFIDQGLQNTAIITPLTTIWGGTSPAVTDVSGLRSSTFHLHAAGSKDELENLELVVAADGIHDDASGTITGTPGDPIVRPDHAINLLTRNWNGTTFDANTDWDFTTLAATYAIHYAASGTRTRQLAGYLEGQVILPDAIEAIMKNTASRIGVDATGKLFVWPWGATGTISATIPPSDIIPEDWDELDATSIINRMRVKYNKSALDTSDPTKVVAPEDDNYLAATEWNWSTTGKGALLAANSKLLYGERPIDEEECELISSDTSANTLLEYNLAAFAYPAQFATIQVPYSKYKTLKFFDVVSFSHPAFPCFYGASGEGYEPVEVGAGAASANLKEGAYWYRAQSYRGLIEGRWLTLPLDGSAPTIRLRIKVLNNYPSDPT